MKYRGRLIDTFTKYSSVLIDQRSKQWPRSLSSLLNGQQKNMGKKLMNAQKILPLFLASCLTAKVLQYRDTGLVDPGSGPILVLYLGRRSRFWVSLFQKILFAYNKDTFCGSGENRLKYLGRPSEPARRSASRRSTGSVAIVIWVPNLCLGTKNQ